jgi:hypothetical protein
MSDIPGYDAWKTQGPPDPEPIQCPECGQIHEGSDNLCTDCLKAEAEAEEAFHRAPLAPTGPSIWNIELGDYRHIDGTVGEHLWLHGSSQPSLQIRAQGYAASDYLGEKPFVAILLGEPTRSEASIYLNTDQARVLRDLLTVSMAHAARKEDGR